MVEPLLEIQELETHFIGDDEVVRAVDNISLSIGEGEVVGLVGESGSGKSVTALSILRLVDAPGRIVGGKILFKRRNGETVDCVGVSETTMRDIRGSEIAMIFQEPMTCLNPVYTIGNQIEEAIEAHGKLSRSDIKYRLIEVLKRVRIPDPERIARSYPHELSGGMRQRAMIAMALSCRPRLLLVDEPTTALDVTIQAQILDLLAKLQEELNMAMLFITHDLGVIAQVSDRVVVMNEGRIVEEAPIRELFAAPKHEYTKMLLNAVPKFKEIGESDVIVKT
jgi:ABC-type dipeptide/oligopeptide/nickel transport system ATPase component